eukprot:PRCOL_00006594-RA
MASMQVGRAAAAARGGARRAQRGAQRPSVRVVVHAAAGDAGAEAAAAAKSAAAAAAKAAAAAAAARAPAPPAPVEAAPVAASDASAAGAAAALATIIADEVATEEAASAAIVHEVEQAATARNIVFVASEAAPYSKTGGLGDVCGSLPPELSKRGHRVMVVVPRYYNDEAKQKGTYANATDTGVRANIWAYGANHEVGFFHEYRDGVDWVFVDNPVYQREGNPYGNSYGAFDDNQFRYVLFTMAACEAPLIVPCGGMPYGEDVVFLANDWHAAFTPVLVAAKYRPHGVYTRARTLLAIHNLSHQGVEPSTTFDGLGIDGEWYKALEWQFPEWARAHELDEGLAVNLLKGAIVTSDRIITVSKGYAWEITTVEGGWGLQHVIQSREFVLDGITNGIDVEDWNPANDEHTAAPYTADDLSGKAECKLALQRELGLPERADVPLIGFIGRLDYQKGPDVILDVCERILRHNDVQLVMLGSGDKDMEAQMQTTENEFRERFRGWVGFSVPVSHRITAGCDILLMPSRFEPCGLNQLYAMRYGAVPVVHATGGLRDTVLQYNSFAHDGEGDGTGFSFQPLSEEGMLNSLFEAVEVYRHDKAAWERIMKRGMTQDLTWGRVAKDYEQVFEWALADPPFC